jgi:hypothetical protein
MTTYPQSTVSDVRYDVRRSSTALAPDRLLNCANIALVLKSPKGQVDIPQDNQRYQSPSCLYRYRCEHIDDNLQVEQGDEAYELNDDHSCDHSPQYSSNEHETPSTVSTEADHPCCSLSAV